MNRVKFSHLQPLFGLRLDAPEVVAFLDRWPDHQLVRRRDRSREVVFRTQGFDLLFGPAFEASSRADRRLVLRYVTLFARGESGHKQFAALPNGLTFTDGHEALVRKLGAPFRTSLTIGITKLIWAKWWVDGRIIHAMYGPEQEAVRVVTISVGTKPEEPPPSPVAEPALRVPTRTLNVTRPATRSRGKTGGAWDNIDDWLAEHAPVLRRSLRPPADRKSVDKLESKLGLTLPPDFVASVLVHDGQNPESGFGLLPPTPGQEGEPAYALLSLVAIGREWAMMKRLLEIGQFEGARVPKRDRGIEDVRWSLGWVPIADNGAGDYVCLDLTPAQGGTVGQLILYGHEGTDQRYVARSFGRYMDDLVRRLQSGKVVWDADEGLIEV